MYIREAAQDPGKQPSPGMGRAAGDDAAIAGAGLALAWLHLQLQRGKETLFSAKPTFGSCSCNP